MSYADYMTDGQGRAQQNPPRPRPPRKEFNFGNGLIKGVNAGHAHQQNGGLRWRITLYFEDGDPLNVIFGPRIEDLERALTWLHRNLERAPEDLRE